jgi:hypothetical protein
VVTIYRERGREISGEDDADMWDPPGSEREREREELGWFFPGWLGWFGPRAQPRWLLSSPFLFFVLFSFSFVF